MPTLTTLPTTLTPSTADTSSTLIYGTFALISSSIVAPTGTSFVLALPIVIVAFVLDSKLAGTGTPSTIFQKSLSISAYEIALPARSFPPALNAVKLSKICTLSFTVPVLLFQLPTPCVALVAPTAYTSTNEP